MTAPPNPSPGALPPEEVPSLWVARVVFVSLCFVLLGAAAWGAWVPSPIERMRRWKPECAQLSSQVSLEPFRKITGFEMARPRVVEDWRWEARAEFFCPGADASEWVEQSADFRGLVDEGGAPFTGGEMSIEWNLRLNWAKHPGV